MNVPFHFTVWFQKKNIYYHWANRAANIYVFESSSIISIVCCLIFLKGMGPIVQDVTRAALWPSFLLILVVTRKRFPKFLGFDFKVYSTSRVGFRNRILE